MMICTTIKERRNIVPVERTEELLDIRQRSNWTSGSKKSAKYHVDMAKRKLPPPVLFYSDSEKHAYRKNKNEQIHLGQFCGHIATQMQVFTDMFDRKVQMERRAQSKRSERAQTAKERLCKLQRSCVKRVELKTDDCTKVEKNEDSEPDISSPQIWPKSRLLMSREKKKIASPEAAKKRPSIKLLWKKRPCHKQELRDGVYSRESSVLSKTVLFHTNYAKEERQSVFGTDTSDEVSRFHSPSERQSSWSPGSSRSSRIHSALWVEKNNSVLLQQRVNHFLTIPVIY